MINLVLLFFIFSLSLGAATRTVCASGCDHTSLSSAATAHSPGDIIEIKAGETFTEAVAWPWKDNPKNLDTIVRSSRWKELPRYGERINPTTHANLVPTLRPTNSTDSIVRFGVDRSTISSVNTSTNRITLDTVNAVTNGDPWACRTRHDGGAHEMPGGLTEHLTFYISSASSFSFIPVDVNGSTIDITSEGTGTRYCTPNKVGGRVIFEGIKFASAPGTESQYAFVLVGFGEESTIEGTVSYVRFRHCIFDGLESQQGPRDLLTLNGRHHEVTDSWLAHAKRFSDESHGILIPQGPGPFLIRNNYINAASISLLTGGTLVTINDVQVSDLVIENNHIQKLGYQLYNEGAGAPTGACLTGRFYRNTSTATVNCSGGGCYRCVADTWSEDTNATFRNDDYLTKSIVEFKICNRCRIEGNWIDTGFNANDTGNQGYCFMATSYAERVNRSIVFKNNRCDYTWAGISIANDFTDPSDGNGPVQIVNNLITNMGTWPAYSIWEESGPNSGGQMRATQFSTSFTNLVFKNNTIRPTSVTFGLLFSGAQGDPNTDMAYENNLIRRGIHVEALSADCSSTGMGDYVVNPTGRFRRNVMYGSTDTILWSCAFEDLGLVTDPGFVSSTDHSLATTSPYSAACASGCAFTGTDGKDIGADIAWNNWYTSGAVNGTARWIPLYTDVGSGFALLNYTAPSSTACSVKLYTNAARTTLHGDTSDAGEQADSRSGSYSSGTQRIFKLGTNTELTASTQYYGLITCGTQIRPFELKTKAAGAATVTYGVQYSTARTGRYSSAPDFSSPTSISSAAIHSIPVSANSVIWYQETGGMVRAYVAP